jgi:nitroimidazol reductase NimA-like FMN-containing flavoprotein (pyridoxamine 5'-phosphate oxidase superfamily)
MEPDFQITDANRVVRGPKRALYDRQAVYQIIDNAAVAHVAIAAGGEYPLAVIPMFHARQEDAILFHGARSSRLMKTLASGIPVCISFTMVDGIVLAKSLFHHSMNYRSVVLFGTGELIEGDGERLAAMKVLSERIMPGRWDDARKPNRKELDATAVVRVCVETASAKVRIGGPLDEPEDLGLPIWSGVVPIHCRAGNPVSDEFSIGLELPDYISAFVREYNSRNAM